MADSTDNREKAIDFRGGDDYLKRFPPGSVLSARTTEGDKIRDDERRARGLPGEAEKETEKKEDKANQAAIIRAKERMNNLEKEMAKLRESIDELTL